MPENADDCCLFRTPMGFIYGPKNERAELGGTALEVLTGAYYLGRVDVQAGDIVMDLGAHLGTFTKFALRRGAKHVIAVEANATNASCLRQTFASEIEAKRVTIVESPVWSTQRLVGFEGRSLTGHIIENAAGQRMTTTIDQIISDLGVERLDFMKADIEGAERHALCGAEQTISRFHPKWAFCVYHYPDDPQVLSEFARKHGYRTHFDGSGRYIYCW